MVLLQQLTLEFTAKEPLQRDGAQNNSSIYLPSGAVETFNSDFAGGGLSQFDLTDRKGNTSLPGNSEQETYNTATPNTAANPNVNVDSNGVLDLSAQQTGADSYSSGAISASQFNSNGGATDIVAELPAGGETWPAFWQLPSNGAWPPETDTLEALGNGQSNSSDYTPSDGWVHVDTHSPTSEGSNGAWVQVKDANGDPINLTDTYNSYESVVDPSNGSNPGSTSYYIDGQQVAQYSDPGSTPNQDMYMEANLAMGGSWGGDGGLGSNPNMNIASITAYSVPDPATGAMTAYNDNGGESS